MNEIIKKLKLRNYDYAVAIATNPEIETGAACGQLAIITGSEAATDCGWSKEKPAEPEENKEESK